jgi:molybdopterin/thiamine biosynthesis adenylyltransferase
MMTEAAPDGLNDEEIRRYMRQLVIPELNQQGQLSLKNSRVLILGAGGLGAPAIMYLAAAGVGHLTIADGDTVAISNLNRQVLFRNGDVGHAKAARAAQAVSALNEHIAVATRGRLAPEDMPLEVHKVDLVVDASDNIETRRAVAMACLAMRRPLVTGAVGQLEGQIAVFLPRDALAFQGFDQLFPDTGAAATCEAVGTIGAVTGVIGSLMAMEAIKALANLGTPIEGRVIHYNALAGTFRDTRLVEQRRLRVLVGG